MREEGREEKGSRDKGEGGREGGGGGEEGGGGVHTLSNSQQWGIVIVYCRCMLRGKKTLLHA